MGGKEDVHPGEAQAAAWPSSKGASLPLFDVGSLPSAGLG